jgi:hypothetical protein
VESEKKERTSAKTVDSIKVHNFDAVASERNSKGEKQQEYRKINNDTVIMKPGFINPLALKKHRSMITQVNVEKVERDKSIKRTMGLIYEKVSEGVMSTINMALNSQRSSEQLVPIQRSRSRDMLNSHQNLQRNNTFLSPASSSSIIRQSPSNIRNK